MRNNSDVAVDPESAARLLGMDDIDAIEDHDLTDPSDMESQSSNSSFSPSPGGKFSKRGHWSSSIPGARWLLRKKTDWRRLIFPVVAVVIVAIIACSIYFQSSQQPVEEELEQPPPPPPPREPEFCTTWPVDEQGNYHPDDLSREDKLQLDSLAPAGGWKKPKGVKVIGTIFYGRRRSVDILDCYLQQNLASNGGYLDEVWFMAHTEDKEDMAWLDQLVEKNPGDYKIVGRDDCKGEGFGCLWKYAVDDKTIYIKMDDDILYIHPDAIPQLVHTRINVQHPFGISANLVNSPVTGMQHYHYGAIHPFLPDPSSKRSFEASQTWRPSEKPAYKSINDSDTQVDRLNIPVPYPGHTWLLTSHNHHDLLKTPMGRYDMDPGGEPIAFSDAWRSWGIGAQQQYSLFVNLEENRMDRYHFGRPIDYPEDAKTANSSTIVPPIKGGPGGEETYDTGFKRYNLNFVAVWGSDIREFLPIADDDEEDLTATVPKRTKRPFLIDTRAVVSHYSFFIQLGGLSGTDLLDRYRTLANEAVCAPTNLKVPMDPICEGF